MPTQSTGRPGGPRTSTEKQIDRKGTTCKVGNLTKDPELKFSDKNVAYARFGLAVETPKVPGEWSGERETTFYEVTVMGDMAENVAQSLTKGARAVVWGRAELEHWTDKESRPQVSKRILADAIGPDLRWATATVTKVTQRQAGGASAPEPTWDDEQF